MNYKEKYNTWINSDIIDEETKSQLRGISDEKEIEDRFYQDLDFGTGGLRGEIGAGSNRMNVYTVAQATQGFANYLKKIDSEFNGTHKFYKHSFQDNRDDVDAKMYPIEAIPIFRRFIYEKWIPENAQKYFKERDPLALDYLPKLLEK